jgi:PAS domain S-box-containing protein
MPHVYCLRDPGLVALHAISDGLTAFAYFLIPIALIYLVRRRRDLAFRWVYLLFGAFILACGTTHVLSIVTLWRPVYRLEGIVKALTAMASLGTAFMMVRLLPRALAIPSAEELRHEIEERRRAEAQVKQLNTELESLVSQRTAELQSANAGLLEFAAILDKAQAIVQKLDGTILIWNSGSETLYGWPRAEALGRKSHELLRTELPQPLSEIHDQLLAQGSWSGEFRQRCRDGSEIWVASFWALHRNAAGDPVSVVKVNNDITELKRTSEALRVSEATARSLFENAGQGILTTGPQGSIVDANAMAQRLFGAAREELVGAPIEALLPGNAAEDQELKARRKDGSEFPVEVSLSRVAEHRNGLAMMFISDITARKADAEEREALISRLEAALSEKTVLLKEVHHRVKNNLAVIAGLLSLQADTLEDERAQVALQESQQRVLSMALIHEYLYSTQHLDRVNFGQYVQQLARELCVTYAVEADMVSVDIEAEEIELGVHRAIPCGLILNELLSNALKYAFPDGRPGRIEVRFCRLESGELSLACQDDGIGMPQGFDWHNSQSLGLRIVRILTRQIDGVLIRDETCAGTRFELRLRTALPL